MPNCPHCGSEVDLDQKMCAWCGKDLSPDTMLNAIPPSAPVQKQAPKPKPPQQPPQRPARPPARTPSQMRVQQGNGPSSEDARLLAKRNDLDGALHLYSLVLQKNPNDQEALFGVGGIHFKRGEYRKASEAWLTLKALNPSYPRIEEWVAQVEKRLAPPPPPPVPRPSPEPPPQSPAVQPKTPPRVEVLQSYTAPLPVPDLSEMDGTEDEDWQRQAVRIDEINEDALKSPLPEPPPPDQREEPKAKKWEFQDEPLDEAPPRWTLSVGWIVVWVYAALVWRIYFY